MLCQIDFIEPLTGTELKRQNNFDSWAWLTLNPRNEQKGFRNKHLSYLSYDWFIFPNTRAADKKMSYQYWLKRCVLRETLKHISFIACSSCCVTCELFMGPLGRAGERPLYQNNSTASRRCDINNKVLTLPLWVLLTANPPLQRTCTHARTRTLTHVKSWPSQSHLSPAVYLQERRRGHEKWMAAIWKW